MTNHNIPHCDIVLYISRFCVEVVLGSLWASEEGLHEVLYREPDGETDFITSMTVYRKFPGPRPIRRCADKLVRNKVSMLLLTVGAGLDECCAADFSATFVGKMEKIECSPLDAQRKSYVRFHHRHGHIE